ncbi:serine hydrolase, partial [Rhodobacteraceae bacterium]|nr:serine hydrolase [Paracoccaceae bacterium]
QTEQEYNRLIPENVRNKTSVNDQRAMFSLLFNVGATNLQNSNALKSFKKGDMSDFYYEGFDKDFGFTKVTGSDNKLRTDAGLVNRRKAELNLAQGNLEDPVQIQEIVLPKRISLKERLKKRAMND